MENIDIFDLVNARLSQIGYNGTDNDNSFINFLIDNIKTKIQNNCNIKIIPAKLKYIWADMVCAEFLMLKKNTGQLDIESLNFDLTEKSIQEGDTKIDFNVDGNMTPEQRFNKVIDYLKLKGKELTRFRKIQW